MRKKIKILLTALLVSAAMAYPAVRVNAEEVDVKQMVQEALKNKTFYHFNTAYYKLNGMPDSKEKSELLNELATIQSTVWTSEVQKTLEMLADMTKTASGKTYYEIEHYVTNSKLGEMDKGYLLGELTSWGRKLVWTEEYAKAMQAVIDLNTKPTDEKLENTEKLIASVKNELSNQFLSELIQPTKEKLKAAADLSTMKKIISLQKDTNLTKEQKVLKIKELAATKNSIKIPEEYLTGDSIYVITEAIMGWSIKESTTIEELQKKINDKIASYVTSLSPIQKIINLQQDEKMTMDQKVSRMIDIAMSKSGIEIPDEYFTGDGIYSLTETMLGWNIEADTTIAELQQRINDKIASYEAQKLKFWFVNVGAKITANSTDKEINITKVLSETIGEKLLPETKIVFKEVGWRKGYKAPLEPSKYLYVKDGQVSMYAKTALTESYKDSVAIEIRYKNGVMSTDLWVEIVPAVTEEKPTVEEKPTTEEKKPTEGNVVIK